jgi:hypothetical protein
MEPEEFICPITQTIMVDPVLGSDGRTYERIAITEWLRTHTTSPITREPMTTASLTSNYALKSMIERHKITMKTTKQTSKKLPKQTNSVERDHYYAIQVLQEEHQATYKPAPSAPPQNVTTDSARQKKILTAFCLIIIFIIMVVIITKIL